MTNHPHPTRTAPMVSVIVPVLGNCPSLTPTLQLIQAALDDTYEFEVLVVADTSVPGPAVRDTTMFSLEHDARVQAHKVRGQKVTAVRWGMEHARGQVIGYLDGDAGWEADPTHLRTIVAAVDTGGADCACAQRDQTHWSTLRRAKTALFARTARTLFHLPITDTQAPMKFFTRHATQLLLTHGSWKGWEFDVDLLWVLHTAGARIHTVPVTWRSNGGEAGWVTALLLATMAPGMIRNLITLRLSTHQRARHIRGSTPDGTLRRS
ncbi:MAG: glycosyltransferase [Pseudonocardiaceae bacterium]